MGSDAERDAASRRSALVQQLMEERRQRLQQKLAANGQAHEEVDDEEESEVASSRGQAWGNVAYQLDLGFESPRDSPPASSFRTPARGPGFGVSPRCSGETPSELLMQNFGQESHSTPATASRPTAGKTREERGLELAQGASWAEPRVGGRALDLQGWGLESEDSTCAQCGSAFLADSVFCRHCGHRRGADSRVSTPQTAGSWTNNGSQSARSVSRPRSAPPTRRRASTPREGFGSKLQEWTLRHQATKQKHQQARQEKETRELEQCTFQPAINSRSEFYARRSRGCFFEPLRERLFHEADKRSTLRSKAKEILDADDLCAYTFRPKINRNRSGPVNDSGRTPLHLRTEAIRQMKEDRVQSMQVAQQRRQGCVFNPQISEKSHRIVQKKRDDLQRSASQGDAQALKHLAPVEERLYAEALEKDQRRSEKQSLSHEASQSAPSVDDTSRRICKSSVYFQGAQQDFVTRQQTFELARRQRRQLRAQHAEAQCPFRPTITEVSRQLVSSHVELLGETVEEQVERLAVRDVDSRRKVRNELEKLQYRECTFKPEVNIVSEALAGSRNEDFRHAGTVVDTATNDYGVHERLYRSALAKSKSSEEGRSEECSFKPQLDPRSARRFSHVKAHYSKDADIMDTIRQEQDRKTELLQEQRRARDEERRASCTFRPELCEAYEEPQVPMVVSGLGRFYELKGMAQRKQQDQKERAAKVFQPNAGGARCGGVTIPEPFNLSTGPEHSCSQGLRASSEWSQG